MLSSTTSAISSSNTGTSQGSFGAPGAGITGGYNGDSTGLKIFIAVFAAISLYNSIELILLCFCTFSRYKGLYFWSLLIASFGVIPYSLAFLLKFFELVTGNAKWMAIVLLTIGWYFMVTGQSVVLWSRLHLIVVGERGRLVLKYTKWMIIIDAIIFHIPTTVLTFGSNGDIAVDTFVHGYNVYEKVQMMGFFIQEIILSSIYIYETLRIIRTSVQQNTRRIMYELFLINIFIICMDIALVGVEFANYYIIETILKGAIYSIKLKLEYAVLRKLVSFVTGGGSSSRAHDDSHCRRMSVAAGFDTGGESSSSEDNKSASVANGNPDVPDFVDPRKSIADTTHAPSTPAKRKKSVLTTSLGLTDSEISLAGFEHVEKSPAEEHLAKKQISSRDRSQSTGRTLTGMSAEEKEWRKYEPI